MTTVYRGAVLHSLGPDRVELLAPGLIEVDGAGTIQRVGREESIARAELRGTRRVDYGDRLLLPGLVDAHLHIPQIDIIGVESEHLIDWLRDHIFKEEAANEDPEIARDRAARCFQELLRSGTTACAAYSSVHTRATEIAFEEAERAGVRAIIGKVLMDREAPSELLEESATSLRDTERLIRQWNGRGEGRLAAAVTPRFGITCSDELLLGAGKLATATGARIQTHLSENKGELAAIHALFPEATDYTAVYENAGLLRSGCLLAHCIHLSSDEIDRIAKADAAAVYCPDSNFFLHSGRF
ncbi:MAG: amidohydrolase family protein, partial [Planctomycetes bacterium]|nr:amidohydrolase family protein [Planctomycetota bacterium]